MEWRVIDFGQVKLAAGLAMNDAIFEAIRDGLVAPTIFVCRISPSAVSIGRFQSFEDEVNVNKCKELGIDFVRRQTGGGAVFHDSNGEIQYAIIAPESLFPKEPLEAYRMVCGGLIDGLTGIGVNAQFVPLNDIVVNGRKISGAAQIIKDGVFLQHGTMLYKPDIKTMFSLLKLSEEKLSDKAIKSAEDRVIGISNLVDVSIDDLKAAMLDGLTKGKEYKIGKLTNAEDDRARSIYTSLYKSDRWNLRR